MEQIQPIVFVVAVVGFTLLTTIWDFKYYRIPNQFTLPMFFAGWIYQGVFEQLSGLGTGALGFLVGFGVLFLLWMIGSAGGGDVKLMGALSVWMGFNWSIYILIVSTVVVIFITFGVVLSNVISVGPKRMKKKLLATGKPTKAGEKRKPETIEQKKQRRIMAYGLPIAIATWGLLILAQTTGRPTFPWLLT